MNDLQETLPELNADDEKIARKKKTSALNIYSNFRETQSQRGQNPFPISEANRRQVSTDDIRISTNNHQDILINNQEEGQLAKINIEEMERKKLSRQSLLSRQNGMDCEAEQLFPSVKKTRQVLMSRESYNQDYEELDGDNNMGNGQRDQFRQPYHTRKDSKPFSYFRYVM